ncbi:MAG: DNA primase [Paramuribaculum sp.]|nr:DNA primase [Paramuribaculum sp.]
MKRIDRATVQRILDTADIVDVVSDFVKLKRRGSGYIGLCPFHNERTPSFSVSKTRNICKCFSCGQGGSPVNFIMLHEQMTYNEALRYLARKYNIEIKEEELTDEERRAADEREGVFAANEWALGKFTEWMSTTDEGRNVGLAYFRERGINDEMIARFRLGYALDSRDLMSQEALKAGFSVEQITASGIAYQPEGATGLRDRFRGRVIYPVFTISGKPVAFGGRTLRTDKKIAKYVNSPENKAYSKSRELYGLYQAKKGIVARDKCILVEGYMDVISMHQSGVDNVVASSGTSLTYGQIRLIHRFTENVTVIYDADAAGIKAALRSVDMLLSEGMKIKILLLPPGEDPDSYAQSHTSAEVEQYIADNETDFIRFKTRILLADAGDDPIARSRVISDIARSISVIPDEILRTSYITDCARSLAFDEKVLSLQVAKFRAEKAGSDAEAEARERARATLTPTQQDPATQTVAPGAASVADPEPPSPHAAELRAVELELARYVVRYAMVPCIAVEIDEQCNIEMKSVVEYINLELESDNITLANSDIRNLFTAALDLVADHREARLNAEVEAEARAAASLAAGREEIMTRHSAEGIAAIERAEKELSERVEAERMDALDRFDSQYAEHILTSSPDDSVRTLANDLAADRHQLSKIHTKYAHVETERERLKTLVPRAVYELKYTLLELQLRDMARRLADPAATPSAQMELMQQMQQLSEVRKTLAVYLGERTLSARR